MPALSIVIVNYNTRDLLRDCLASIPREEVEGCEVIVVDNASKDDSCAMVRRDFAWVRLMENTSNGGFSKGNNQGIRAAAGDYILLLNSDTIVRPGALRSKVQFLKAHPDAGGVVGPMLDAEGNTQATVGWQRKPGLIDLIYRLSGLSRLVRSSDRRRRFLRRYLAFALGKTVRSYLDAWVTSNSPLEVEGISGASMMLRREATGQVGLLDENIFMYLEDIDYCMRLRKAGWKLYYVPGGGIVHLVGKSSGGRMRQYGVQSYQSLFYFYTKHHSSWALSTARLLVLFAMCSRWLWNLARGAFSDDSVYTQNRLDLEKVIGLCIRWRLPEPESVHRFW